MKRFLKKILPVEPEQLIPPAIVDDVLGTIVFDPEHGWRAHVSLGKIIADIDLGSERPTKELLNLARAWVIHWEERWSRIIAYLREKLATVAYLDPTQFEVEAILLGYNDLTKGMMFLRYPGDEYRGWHIDLNGYEPSGLAFDD